jgi:hypothetical protein
MHAWACPRARAYMHGNFLADKLAEVRAVVLPFVVVYKTLST